MAPGDLLESLLKGTAPKDIRALAARGALPFPRRQMIEILVHLVRDADPAISFQAVQSLRNWDKNEILQLVKTPHCPAAVLQYFAASNVSTDIMQAVIENPGAPQELIASLASTVPSSLLRLILQDRTRIDHYPHLLEHIKQNPAATPEILNHVRDIEIELSVALNDEYANQHASNEIQDAGSLNVADSLPNSTIQPEELLQEGSPSDPKARQTEFAQRIASLPHNEKLRLALFGTREIRMLLVRDTNKELARAVLRSPKLTESEVEAITAMRGVGEEILRDIGNNKKWTKNYNVVQNLVKNPKTPVVISQRLLPRLHTRDLDLLTRDRSIPDAVRYNATRTLNQRNATRSSP